MRPLAWLMTRSSCRAKPRPWMMPPSTWLEAVSGLTTRPISWAGTMRSTRTSPGRGAPPPAGTDQALLGVVRPGGEAVEQCGGDFGDGLAGGGVLGVEDEAVAGVELPSRELHLLGGGGRELR